MTADQRTKRDTDSIEFMLNLKKAKNRGQSSWNQSEVVVSSGGSVRARLTVAPGHLELEPKLLITEVPFRMISAALAPERPRRTQNDLGHAAVGSSSTRPTKWNGTLG